MSAPKERPPLEEMTLRQLRRVASELGISRYSRMRKDQLLASIQTKSAGLPASSPTPPTAPPAIAQVIPVRTIEAQEAVEAAKFDLGQPNNLADLSEELILDPETLSGVDEGLPDLPGGYGESRILLLPRDPQWAYTYWDIPNEHKAELRAQGGLQLALRVYDVTDLDLSVQRAHTVQEFPCDELAREWYLPIPISDRDYAIEIGYRCGDGRWLVLARSAPVRIPPVYPSDWIEDVFVTVDWEQDLRGTTVATLIPPAQKAAQAAEVSPQEIQLINGSGLGEENRISPRAACGMFLALERYLQPYNMTIADVVAIVGQDLGVLESRNIPKFSIIKTGSLDRVSTLAGVIPTQNQGNICMAIMNIGGELDGFRNQQDNLLQGLLTQWGSVASPPPEVSPTAWKNGKNSKSEIIKPSGT